MRVKMCGYPGCTRYTTGTYYCNEHERKQAEKKKAFLNGKRGASASYNPLYHSSRWRRERAEFLKRNPRCVMCGEMATTVDHIVPHHGIEAFFWDHANWQAMCTSCHTRKTLAENGYFRKKNKTS